MISFCLPNIVLAKPIDRIQSFDEGRVNDWLFLAYSKVQS
jgi:hypothetical protein